MSKFRLAAKIILAVIIISQSVNFVSAQTEAEKQGKEIYEKYQTALGGKENLAKIKTIETILEVENYGIKGKQTMIEDKVSTKLYILTEEADGRRKEVGFDGSNFWTKSDQSNGYMNVPFSGDKNPKRIKLPNETIDGKEYLVVQISVADMPSNERELYDPATFLLAYRISTAIVVNGFPTETKTTFSDYRKVGDILVPFLEVTNNYFGTSTKKIVSTKQNIEVDSDIFEYAPKKKNTPKPMGND